MSTALRRDLPVAVKPVDWSAATLGGLGPGVPGWLRLWSARAADGSAELGAALLGTLPIAPILAGVITVAAAVVPIEVVPLPLQASVLRHPLMAGLLNLTVAWGALAVAFLVFGMTRIEHANSEAYFQLDEAIAEVDAMCQAVGCQQLDADEHNSELGQEHRRVCAEIERHQADIQRSRSRKGAEWLQGIGYIGLWSRVHRAQEALIEIEPASWVVKRAQYDYLRISDSNLDNNQVLTERLLQAVRVLQGETAEQPTQSSDVRLRKADPGLQPPTNVAAARTLVSTIRRTLNEFRDESRAGLVRARNQLMATTAFTAITLYTLLWLAIAAEASRETLMAALAFYMEAALVGLFGRLHAEFGADAGVDDFGLSTTRLIVTPLLSGVAGVLGVVVVAMAAATQATGGAPLPAAFNLGEHPLSVMTAAAFGLTPGLLIDRLNQRVENYKDDLKGSQAPGSKARRTTR